MDKYTPKDFDTICEDLIDGLGVSIHKSIEESIGFKKLKGMVTYASSVLRKIDKFKSQIEDHKNKCNDWGLVMLRRTDDEKLKLLDDLTKME